MTLERKRLWSRKPLCVFKPHHLLTLSPTHSTDMRPGAKRLAPTVEKVDLDAPDALEVCRFILSVPYYNGVPGSSEVNFGAVIAHRVCHEGRPGEQ